MKETNRYYEACARCSNGGFVYHSAEQEECEDCEGKGFKVTKEGSELLKFLEKMRVVK